MKPVCPCSRMPRSPRSSSSESARSGALPTLLTALVLALWLSPAAADGPPQTLLDVYQQALLSDPQLASARSGNRAAQELIEQGKALSRPTVNFTSNANRSETDIRYIGPGSVFRTEGRQSFEVFGFGINISQPLFRKQNSVQYQQALTQVAQADRELLLAEQSLMLRVAQAYFDVLLAEDRLSLLGAQKAAILRQLDQAKASFEVGTVAITDVNEAQARADLVAAQQLAAENQLQASQHAVQAIIGQPASALARARRDFQPQLPEPQKIEPWVELAEQNNLALTIRQQALLFAQQEVDRANAGHLPTLDLVGAYTDTYANGSANGFGSDLQSAVIGLQLQVPLYQGGAISSRARQAVANQQKAQDDVETARRQAALETRQSYLQLMSDVAQIRAYEQALTSSESQLESTNLGYEVGMRNSVDVLNAQQQLFNAKRDLLQSRYSYLLSTLRLKAAVGLLTPDDLAIVNQQLDVHTPKG